MDLISRLLVSVSLTNKGAINSDVDKRVSCSMLRMVAFLRKRFKRRGMFCMMWALFFVSEYITVYIPLEL